MKKIIQEVQDYIDEHPEASDLEIWEDLSFRLGNIIFYYFKEKSIN